MLLVWHYQNCTNIANEASTSILCRLFSSALWKNWRRHWCCFCYWLHSVNVGKCLANVCDYLKAHLMCSCVVFPSDPLSQQRESTKANRAVSQPTSQLVSEAFRQLVTSSYLYLLLDMHTCSHTHTHISHFCTNWT